jgi:hypothetical protein
MPLSLKKIARLTGDTFDMVSRGQLIWQLLTLTKPGQLVLASLVAVGIFSLAIVRSDPWVSAILFALVAFAVVAVIVRFLSRLNTRPHLKHGNIVGMQYEFGDANSGTEEGGFMWGRAFFARSSFEFPTRKKQSTFLRTMRGLSSSMSTMTSGTR